MKKLLHLLFISIFLFSLLTVQICIAQDSAMRLGNIAGLKFDIKATGRTNGHVANLSIQNTTGDPITLEIPAMRLPATPADQTTGRAAKQGFIIPEPTQADVPPNSTVEILLEGYCADPHLPTPATGSDLPPVDTWDPESPLITQVQDVIRSIPNLQDDGVINTPFSVDPDKESTFLVQQTVWWYSAGSDYDPCTNIRQAMDHTRDTDWYSMDEDDVERFISQITDALVRIGHATGSPNVSVPVLPVDAGPVTPALPSGNPQIENNVRVTGTNQTTGKIAEISVHNPTNEPITVQIGDGSPLFIPAKGHYQPYVVPSIPLIHIEPGQAVTVSVEGYCVDVRKPPVPSGDPMPPISEWIQANPRDLTSTVSVVPQVPDEMNPPSRRNQVQSPVQTAPQVPEPMNPPGGSKRNKDQSPVQTAPQVPEPMNPPGGSRRNLVHLPVQTAPPLVDVVDLLENLPPPRMPEHWNCPELPPGTGVLIPGTDTPVRTPIHPDIHTGLAVPVLLEAIDRIIQTTDQMMSNGLVNTPFSGQPVREREAIIQQTFWIFSADLSGERYIKQDFAKKTEDQFQSATGRPYNSLPQAQREQLDAGVDDFWNSFQAVGAEAKILPDVPITPPPSIPSGIIDNFSRKYARDQPPGVGVDNISDPPGITFQQRKPPPEGIREKCECDNTKIEFKLKLNKGKEKHYTAMRGEAGLTHTHDKSLKDGEEVKFEIPDKDLKIYCSTCAGKSCNPTKIDYKITSPDIVGGKIKRGSDSKDIEVKIIFTWICEGGKDCDPSVLCTNQFTYIIPRGSCDCDDYSISGEIEINPVDGSDKKTENIEINSGGEITSVNKAKKDDEIKIKINEVKPKCKDCDKPCKPDMVKISMLTTNLTGYTSTSEENIKNKTSINLLNRRTKVENEIDTVVKLKVSYECTANKCETKKCPEKEFKIKIPIEK